MIRPDNLDETVPIACNTEDEVIYGNMDAAIALDLPWLHLEDAHDGVAVIVGGGPSMKGSLGSIAAHQGVGHKIFAVNGVTPLLSSVAVVPDYFVLLDAREENLPFIHPHPKTHNLLASQCPPAAFEALDGLPITLWHPNYPGVEDRLGGRRCVLIGGGSTVGLQAMSIAYTLGYRTIHLYGFDSSYSDAGDGHAYPQALNDGDGREIVSVGGMSYVAAPWMVRQAMEFQTASSQLAEGGAEIMVHGSGLLPAVAKMMLTPITEGEKYRQMWSLDAYRVSSPGERFAPEFVQRTGIMADQSVIDFGCGTGRGGQAIYDLTGCDVTLTDFAANCLDENVTLPFEVNDLTGRMWMSADFGYCTDVMEHIPPEDVQAVIDNIMACVDRCFFKIALFHDNMGEMIGHPLHLSVFPPEWWQERFAAYTVLYERFDTEIEFPYATVYVQKRHERAH